MSLCRGSSGSPVPIIESRVTSAASCASLEALGAGRAHRQHQVAHFGGGVPTRISVDSGSVTPKSASTPRGSFTARER